MPMCRRGGRPLPDGQGVFDVLTMLACVGPLATLVAVEDLPLIAPGVTVYQQSSHNKDGLNGDGGFWLYDDEAGEPGLCAWNVVDEGAVPEYTTERVHSGTGALCHRVTRAGRESGWRSINKTLSAGLNMADCDAVTLWVWPTYADGGVDYGIRIDSGDHYTELPIGDLKAGQWNEVTVDIRDVPREGVSTFWLLFHLDWGCPDEMAFYVDDIAFRRPDGATHKIDDFETWPKWHVVMDSLGPGCLRNMWGLGGGKMRIEVDGETYAEADQTDLFEGKAPLFQPPLVSRAMVCSGPWKAAAHWSFVPIPFRERCRVLTSNPGPFNHYIWERYRDPKMASPERARADEERISSDWARIGEDPKPWTYAGRLTGAESLAAGATLDLGSIEDAGAIGLIRLRISPHSDAILDSARLRIRWDGEEVPSVDAPLGIFFGAGVTWRKVSSLLIGTQGSWGYCYIPMPFWRGARVEIANDSAEAIDGLAWDIAWSDQPYPRERAGYFRTWFHHDPATALGRDYLFLETKGQGQLLGVVQTLIGGHYCEGDIRFYADGSRTPQLYGTGSEDYYHSACWPNTDQHTPFHGCVGDVAEEAAERGISFYDIRSCYYRFHLEAPIRFQDGARFGIEHGGVNDTVSDYTSLAYYYAKDEAGLRCTDTLTLGSAPSETGHTLSCATGERTSLTGFFEGDFDDVPWTFSMLATSEPVRVTLKLDRTNAGVRLRRVFDQLADRQRALVTVDGQPAGDWYDPDENRYMRLAESDFEVPDALTVGKERITVEFRPYADSPAWTLGELRALCYVGAGE